MRNAIGAYLKGAVKKAENKKEPLTGKGKSNLAALLEKTDNPYTLWILGGLLLSVIIFVYAGWVGDNDLWWHMKYGEYMLQHKTLRPDHTVFSWVGTDKDWVYVSWLPETAYYLMYKFGGLPLLFMFRYLCIAFIAGIIIFYGLRVSGKTTVFMSLLVALLVIAYIKGSAIQLKPELLSIVFFASALFIYLYGKDKNSKIFFVYPLLFLIWVNSHGVFIFGFLLTGLLLAGEIINYIFKLKGAMPSRDLKVFFISVAASFLTIFLNPYGIDYPLYLYKYLTSPAFQEYSKTIAAIKSPLDALKESVEKMELYSGKRLAVGWDMVFLVGMMSVSFIAALIILFKKGILHVPMVLVNIAFAVLYFKALRTAFFYPIVWGFTMLYLYPHVPLSEYKNRLIAAVCLVLFVAHSGNLLYMYSTDRLWLGIGGEDTYMPVKELAFLRRHDLLKYPLFTEYYIGGYLLWALYPEHKIFIDPRGGPYLNGVYQDYADLFLKQNIYTEERLQTYSIQEVLNKKTKFERFTSKYPFKVAIIAMDAETVVFQFLFSEDWRLIYFDTNAVIFAHKSVDLSNIKVDLGPKRFGKVKNIAQLAAIFTLYLNIKDANSAAYILEVMKMNFKGHYLVDYCDRMMKAAMQG